MPKKKLSFPRRNADRIAHTNRMNNDLLTILIIEAFLIAGLAAFLLRRRRHMITEAQDGLGAVRGAAEEILRREGRLESSVQAAFGCHIGEGR